MVYEWERRFQSHILSRGWNYAADGAVSGLNKNGDSDPRVESYIRSSIRDKKLSVDIKKIENEIDGIFMAFAGHDGYIDYNNASDFECSLVSLLENRSQDLIDDEKYEEAFDLSVYAYVKTGNCDIDDDGQINMIAVESKLRDAAEKDYLTGLNNRNVMTKYLEELHDNDKAYDTYWLAMTCMSLSQ